MKSIEFLPEKLREVELYREACSIIDHVLEEDERYYDAILGKYKDSSLDMDSLNSILSEYGYDYIVKVLNIDAERLSKVVSYISLIGQLKGHRSGLFLILKLLNVKGDIQEWWERDYRLNYREYDENIDKTPSNYQSKINELKEFVKGYLRGKGEFYINIPEHTEGIGSYFPVRTLNEINIEELRGLLVEFQRLNNTQIYESFEESLEEAMERGTFKLDINMNLSDIKKDTITYLFDFVGNYVLPNLKYFNLVYYALLDERVLLYGGYVDTEIESDILHSFTLVGGFSGIMDGVIYGVIE